jgi:transmembrane protein 216
MQTGRGSGGVSFPLQIFLNIALVFSPFWWAITFSLLIYKGTRLPFPNAALPVEIVVSALLVGLQYIAVRFGKRGNLTESTKILLVAAALLTVASVGFIYYMWLQTYVMMLDLAFSAAQLGLNGITLLMCVVAIQNASSLDMMHIPTSPLGAGKMMRLPAKLQEQAATPQQVNPGAQLPPQAPSAPPANAGHETHDVEMQHMQ